MPGEQELQLDDVSADHAEGERSRAERGAAEPAEQPPCPRSGDAVGHEPAATLELDQGSGRGGPGVAVDRSGIEVVCAESDLERSHPRASHRQRRRSGEQ